MTRPERSFPKNDGSLGYGAGAVTVRFVFIRAIRVKRVGIADPSLRSG